MDVSGQSLLPMVAILLMVVPGALPKVFGGMLLAFVLGACLLRVWLRARSRRDGDAAAGRGSRYRGAHVAP